MTIRSAIALATITCSLAACGSDAPEQETAAEADRGAKGEVLGGTISDDMLPLDRLRSQSPPLNEASGDGDEEPSEDGE